MLNILFFDSILKPFFKYLSLFVIINLTTLAFFTSHGYCEEWRTIGGFRHDAEVYNNFFGTRLEKFEPHIRPHMHEYLLEFMLTMSKRTMGRLNIPILTNAGLEYICPGIHVRMKLLN